MNSHTHTHTRTHAHTRSRTFQTGGGVSNQQRARRRTIILTFVTQQTHTHAHKHTHTLHTYISYEHQHIHNGSRFRWYQDTALREQCLRTVSAHFISRTRQRRASALPLEASETRRCQCTAVGGTRIDDPMACVA